MATSRKRKVRTVADDSYSELETYCIWLNEFYKALRKAGFNNENALWVIATKDAYPDWVSYGVPTEKDIQKYLDEDED